MAIEGFLAPGTKTRAALALIPDETAIANIEVLLHCIFMGAFIYSLYRFWKLGSQWITAGRPGGNLKDREGIPWKMFLLCPLISATFAIVEALTAVGWFLANRI